MTCIRYALLLSFYIIVFFLLFLFTKLQYKVSPNIIYFQDGRFLLIKNIVLGNKMDVENVDCIKDNITYCIVKKQIVIWN